MNQHQDDSDPYDWSIDRVVAEVAQDDSRLAESLRVNEVDGEVLLTVCTYERLKDDIGIIPLGKRSKIMRTIQELRKGSNRYKDYILDAASNIALPDDTGSVMGSPAPRSAVLAVGFSTPMPEKIRSLEIPSFATPINPRKRKGALNTPLTSLTRSSATPEPQPLRLESLAGVQPRKSKPLSLLASGDDNLPLFVPESALHFPNHAAVRIVRDKGTGMGRAIPFTQERASSEPPSKEEEMGGEIEMDVGYDHAQSPSPAGRLSDGHVLSEYGDNVNVQMGTPNNDELNVQMHMSPEPFIAPEEEEVEQGLNDDGEVDGEVVRGVTNESKRVKGALRKRRYLLPKGLTADELIYGKLELGAEIHNDEGEDEFFIQSSHQPPGQQRYIERQIRYLLRSAEFASVVHQGHLRTGIKPYKESLVQKHYHQAVTLYTVQKDGSCKVYRRDTATVELPWGVFSGATKSSSDVQIIRFPDQSGHAQPKLSAEDNSIHDWDYLLKWQNIDDDKELPLLGESGSENEYSVETWKEIEAEAGPQERPLGKSNREPLTVSEIKAVLDEGVNLIIDNWRNKILPRKEAQAYRIYRVARKRKERKKNARDAKVRIKELDERLEKMRVELCGVVWTRKAFVKKQVAIMQPTVVDREEQKWLAALMERKKTPEKPEKVARAEVTEEGEDQEMLDNDVEDDGDDEESLGSTSEEDYDSGNDEGMDDFIVADNEKDMVNGMEVEVEGEKELEEELARKAAENELVDSSDSEDDPLTRVQKLKADQSRSKAPEGEGEDHPMTGMGDEEEEEAGIGNEVDEEMVGGIERAGEEVVQTPRLDKGKEKAKSDSPIPNVKKEPPATEASVTNPVTPSSRRKNIPIIDLTLDDSPEKSPTKSVKPKSVKPKKGIKEVINLMDDDDEIEDGEETPPPPRQSYPYSLMLTELVKAASDSQRETMWYRLDEVKPYGSLHIFFRD